MYRSAIVTVFTLCAGCLFGGSDLEGNAEPNAAPNNLVTNNQTTGTANNVTSPNIAPNIGTCDLPDLPGCDLEFACTPDATDDCPGCGVCDGVCAGRADGLIGVCVQMTPIDAAAVPPGEESFGIGASVAIADQIFIGQPELGPGRVIVANLDGGLAGEIRAPDNSMEFGAALDAVPTGTVIGCPGCGPRGQVYFADGEALVPVYLVPDGATARRVGEQVAILNPFDAVRVVIGAPASDTAMFFERDDAGFTLVDEQTPPVVLFGISVAADGNLALVGSSGSDAQVGFALPNNWVSNDITSEASSTRVTAISQPGRAMAIGGETELEVFALQDMSVESLGITRAGSGTWIAATFGEQLFYAGLSTGEVRILRLSADGLLHLGSLMIPGLSDLDADNGVVVAGARGASGDDAVYAWRISIR